MPDEMSEDSPAPQPPPQPGARKDRRIRYQKRVEPGSTGMIAGLAVTLTLGSCVVFVLISGSMMTTQGARASTRLQWEQRQAEIDRIAAQAEADGKLRRP